MFFSTLFPSSAGKYRWTECGCSPVWKDFISAGKCCELPGSIPCRNPQRSPWPRRVVSHSNWILFLSQRLYKDTCSSWCGRGAAALSLRAHFSSCWCSSPIIWHENFLWCEWFSLWFTLPSGRGKGIWYRLTTAEFLPSAFPSAVHQMVNFPHLFEVILCVKKPWITKRSLQQLETPFFSPLPERDCFLKTKPRQAFLRIPMIT